ncbi:(2Fe-2S)-binding protein [Allokutzneria oryzae]|uniref:(2Fe-2S)-binding protein n=1 Tax=Allokutzneria oryzae TaxID=1378989 RepID=A0ABV5ZVG6_9PSEU
MERFGGYFVVGVVGVDVAPGGPALREVYRGEGLAGRIDDVCRRLGTTERRVGASILFQGYAARVWSPLLGAVALGLPVPALDSDEIHWTESGFVSARPLRESTETITAIAVEQHLEPMMSALRKEVPVADGLLWGNAASSLVGTMKVIANAGALDRRTSDVAAEVLEHDALRAAGGFTDGGYQRRSCCLYYRVPGGGLCGDCVLAP